MKMARRAYTRVGQEPPPYKEKVGPIGVTGVIVSCLALYFVLIDTTLLNAGETSSGFLNWVSAYWGRGLIISAIGFIAGITVALKKESVFVPILDNGTEATRHLRQLQDAQKKEPEG